MTETFLTWSALLILLLIMFCMALELALWAIEHIDAYLVKQDKPQGVQTARQGHRYLWQGKSAIALETGTKVKILIFNQDKPWRDYLATAQAAELIPQPMAYFQGQTPK